MKYLYKPTVNRRHHLLNDITYENVTKWKKSHWPYGIKADLARELPLVGDLGEVCLFREQVSQCGEMLVTWETEDMEGIVNMHCWSLRHPKKTWPEKPAWRRGSGFAVPARFAPHWARGVKLLLENHRGRLERKGECLFEIQYGESYEVAAPHRIRFFYWRTGRNWYAIIRKFRWKKKEQAFIPTMRHVYWRVDTPRIGETFYRALERAGTVYREASRPADSLVTIKLEKYRGGF